MAKGLAIISGATGGIGRVVTEHCWRAGYSVLALGHTLQHCETLRAWFPENPVPPQEAKVLCLDLAQSYDLYKVNNAMDTLLRNVTLLVTCHGYPPTPTDARYCADVARKIWQCDVMGTVHLCELVGRKMVEQCHGSIVLLSSAHAHATYPGRAPYCMAKASICALARALAVEWGQHNITVNSLSPWQVANERTDEVAAQEYAASGIDTLGLYRQRAPLGRLVQPEDIARMVLWLAETPSVTGQDIRIDCGVSASMWHRPFFEEGA